MIWQSPKHRKLQNFKGINKLCKGKEIEEIFTTQPIIYIPPYRKFYLNSSDIFCNFQVRSHITHIFYEVEKSKSSNDLMSSILETCWSTECVSPTLAEYRQRLKVLRKLDCSSRETIRDAVAKGVIDGRVPLRYLLGHLFINFKLLWEPVSAIIIGYSNTMEPATFWEIYREQMDWVASEILESKPLDSHESFFVCKNYYFF